MKGIDESLDYKDHEIPRKDIHKLKLTYASLQKTSTMITPGMWKRKL